jgi:transposase InsO family protein
VWGKTRVWVSPRDLVAAKKRKPSGESQASAAVMRERGLLVRSRRLRARRKKEWGRVEAAEPNQIWQSDMTKIWAGPTVGWAYLVSVIDCCTREIVSWNLSHRCRTEEALDAVEQAVHRRTAYNHPEGNSYRRDLLDEKGDRQCRATN